MFSTPAYAQSADAAAATGPIAVIMNILPLVGMLVVFYFLLIRPQQQRLKAHQALIAGIIKGDTVVTSGGMIGKVTKVEDNELSVELAPSMVVKVVRNTITEVRGKTAANENK